MRLYIKIKMKAKVRRSYPVCKKSRCCLWIKIPDPSSASGISFLAFYRKQISYAFIQHVYRSDFDRYGDLLQSIQPQSPGQSQKQNYVKALWNRAGDYRAVCQK